jgi:hypothetical protein
MFEAQQRPPTQVALAHQSFAEHDAATGWLFFALQVKSAVLRKWVEIHVLHLPIASHDEHPVE